MKLKDIPKKPHKGVPGGIHQTVLFPNGWGLSIVSNSEYFYVDKKHPYEIAVIVSEDSIPEIVINPDDQYEYRIDCSYTDEDVIGHLTEEDVDKWLEKVEKFEPLG